MTVTRRSPALAIALAAMAISVFALQGQGRSEAAVIGSMSKPRVGTTVRGPRMWDPARQRKFATPATVTVSHTSDLVNEMVHVSWTGFTPSSNVLYDPTITDYPVMVAECNSPAPKSSTQCYGANNGGVEGAIGPEGPMNTAYATTAPNGTGQLDIQILTLPDNDNQFLGCSFTHRCSLVIVPSQGGNTLSTPVNCADHSQDTGGTDLGQVAFSSQTGQCSWADRIVVPLTFAKEPSSCPIRNASFTALGSPMLGRAMAQWQAGLCNGANPLAIIYNSAITEPEAIQDLPSGLGDIALTTRPGPVKEGGKTYTYAPVAISAVAIAYWIDNPVTGEPVQTLRLDPRLVVKLLTQSYDFEGEGCGNGPPPKVIGCDGAVDGNPLSLFDDPEFKYLNPKVQSPAGYGAYFQVPTVESGHSDMTWEVTRWIAANPGAVDFMRGQFDPWGMHMNTDYYGSKYPQDSFTGQDSYPVIAHKYNPIFPLSLVAQYQAENWDPGTDWEKDETGNFEKDPIEVPGERALFAVVDEGDAAAFRFPVAELLNSKGQYVAPNNGSMRAALSSMAQDGNRLTRDVDYAKQRPNAYPLTMIIYAMVPTSGISHAKAKAIARFLDYVAGPGQVSGVQPGQLPPGYLPLTASMRAQTRTAAGAVLAQAGAHGTSAPGKNSSHASGQNPSPTASASPTPSDPPSPTPSPSATTGQAIRVALVKDQVAGLSRYAVPAVLVAGGAVTLTGALLLVAGAGPALILAPLRTVRRVARRRARM
jgi:hypothetical protein